MPTGFKSADELMRAQRIVQGLPPQGILRTETGGPTPFRISPEPFPLPAETVDSLARQGTLWLSFLKAAQEIYLRSLRGEAPGFVAEYLDAGKPARLQEYGRMNRFRQRFPPVIRPDLLLTDDGPAACELDSIPGGFGMLACLSHLHAAAGSEPVGGAKGMVEGFARALAFAGGTDRPRSAIVVSEESRMYRPEMEWMAGAMREAGHDCEAAAPADLAAGSGGVTLGGRRLDVAYRFFELFDLPNVPGAEELMTAAKLKRVALVPAPKPFLEEKLLFALLHHPRLEPAWEELLGESQFRELRSLVIPTWVMDARPVPPHAVVAGFEPGGHPLASWDELSRLTQRERELVIKPSGFSEEAWGSHGVRFGQDMSRGDWMRAVAEALEAFPERPHVIQPYRRPAVVPIRWLDHARSDIVEGEGRVRLTPYYFVTGPDDAELGGVLATVCPADKKAVHGMPDAVMAPCAARAAGGRG